MIPMLDEVYGALMKQKKRQAVDKEIYKDIYADQTGHYLPQRPFMDKYHQFLYKCGIMDIYTHVSDKKKEKAIQQIYLKK